MFNLQSYLDNALATVLVMVLVSATVYAVVIFRRYEPQVAAWITAHLSAKNLALLQSYAHTAVVDAEKKGLDLAVLTKVKTEGAKKKAWAIDFLQGIVDTQNIPVNVGEVDALVETAWSNEFGGWLKKFEEAPLATLEETLTPAAQ